MKINFNAVGILGVLTVLFLALNVLSFATATSSTTPAEVRNRIEQKVRSEGLYNVSITVNHGNVLIEGTVQTLADRLRVERIARESKDGVVVINNLALENSRRAGEEIASDVARSIQTYYYYDVFDWVSATVNNGEVTLKGWARQPWRKDDYEKRVTEIPGVVKVNNQIRVLPVSLFDERLRIRVARMIYQHPTLSRYGIGAHPAIHIIVENGRVFLEGNVDSKSAQSVASMIAHQSSAFKVNNELKVE